MTRITPMDLSFLLLERANPAISHGCVYDLPKPKGQQSLGKDVAAWETVEPDMRNHVRHIDIPEPGPVHEPFRLVQLSEEAFHELQVEADRPAPGTARRPHQPA